MNQSSKRKEKVYDFYRMDFNHDEHEVADILLQSKALHSERVQKSKGAQKSKDIQKPTMLRSYMDQKLLGTESLKALRSQVSFRRRRRSEAELQWTIRSQRFKDHKNFHKSKFIRRQRIPTFIRRLWYFISKHSKFDDCIKDITTATFK
ncbi:hypothetical protein TSUD_363710 [Trifolium subterraneum]|uniref:Uncharacterized protein n=1 Tax=Trifolium subterraneum TaxID=3900 RepID=A0A2Z6MWC4_TRISU|nr:hypothetical protein TSUD_363710 [Trifolium subterraneum]